MISIFSCPKPFRGHINLIQRNAIASWLRLDPAVEVILFGNEEGTADVAKEFGIRHEAEIKRNEYGTPLLSDMFGTADRTARHATLAFVNTDIVLMHDFGVAVHRIKAYAERFLMIGECRNLDVTTPLSFGDPDWEPRLREEIRQRGPWRGLWGIDYFVYPKRLYQDAPPFAIGRAGFDNWLVWRARDLKVPVINASNVVTAVHQNHDYAHVSGGQNGAYWGKEAQRNTDLAGGRQHFFTIGDASHKLRRHRITPYVGGYFRLRYRCHVLLVNAAKWTRPVRRALGVRGGALARLRLFFDRARSS